MNSRNLLIHLLSWGIIICFPLVSTHSDMSAGIIGARMLRGLGGPLTYMCMFYINYLWLVPDKLLENKYKSFFSINVCVIVLCVIFQSWWWQFITGHFPELDLFRPKHLHKGTPWHIYFQSTLTLVLFGGLSVALCMSSRLQKAEQARQQAEKSRTEAELKNLQNQLNPHFLLNTLNNIYALIQFEPDKAQTSVAELSRLLRYVLYEANEEFVPLGKEAAFIGDYIELMRIRLPKGVTLETDINIKPDDATPIAPLIFISIIENAFKHGVSPTGKGHIFVSLSNDTKQIVCRISNSNHPKPDTDQSGHGIGLEQVERRLNLMYDGKYSWEKGIDNDSNDYYSTITLRL